MLRAAGIALLINGLAILVFGIVIAALPASDPSERAAGVASLGMGLFGSAISLFAFRRLERWAWCCLWFYPAFWAIHLAAGLSPGQDHVHQVVFIALSLAALVLSYPAFFGRRH
jgi:hypothetical protein